MPQLATICYIDNGKELLMLHRNKNPMISMKGNGLVWVVS
ncbi:Mutator mutT protein (7,8-dihydro-8-oxoguanine-triphosphatase) [Streptococcus pneumoniae]|nr:Mutator mutT protein (7,8-dihydro-8-oxoguanine-triphosphatase) [Streptococcus pneumoniae]